MAESKPTFFKSAFQRVFAQKDDAFWKPASGEYPRLAGLDAAAFDLKGKAGLYVLWHLGVRPQWLKAGVSADLAVSFAELAQMPDFLAYERNRGVFAAWACPGEQQRAGLAASLIQVLKPALQGISAASDVELARDTKPVECPLPPGTSNPALGSS